MSKNTGDKMGNRRGKVSGVLYLGRRGGKLGDMGSFGQPRSVSTSEERNVSTYTGIDVPNKTRTDSLGDPRRRTYL